MVWCLSPSDSAAPGPFYFTAPGVHSVGRKDCTITIQTDKSISRLHAEISVEAAPPLLATEDHENLPRCKIFVKDLSKFGTFVNRDIDSRPIHSFPDKVAMLKEGDNITFGTDKAVFRVQYVPIILCMPPSTFPGTTEARLKAEAVGAYVFEQWKSQCTHLLVEDNSPVSDLVIAAVLSRKPVVLIEWLQALTSPCSPRDQLPSLSRYIPTLKIDSGGLALPTRIAEPLEMEETLSGYTVFLQKGCRYHYHDLSALTTAAGGVVKVFTKDNLKDVAGLVQQNGLLVFPAEQASKDWFRRSALTSVKHLQPTSEEYLLRSILSAKVDLSLASLSPAASVETDETVAEEHEEMEDDAATSVAQVNVQAAGLQSGLPSWTSVKKIKEIAILDQPNAALQTSSVWKSDLVESIEDSQKGKIRNSTLVDTSNRDPLTSRAAVKTGSEQPVKLASVERAPMAIPKTEVALGLSDGVKADIIFHKGLVVRRDENGFAADTWNAAGTNFKRFKKAAAASGNSFSSLVPFAKDPYRESLSRQEMGDFLKQEKKRKEAESLAEDLFNAERLKRRRVTAVKEARASISGTR